MEYRLRTRNAETICCEMPNPNDVNPVEVLREAMWACRFPDRFSSMTQDQLLAYQTLRNAENYLLGNGMAVSVVEVGVGL